MDARRIHTLRRTALIGAFALVFAGGITWADDSCRTDGDCQSGKLCGTDNHCHDDLCRTDANCRDHKLCGNDSKCHDAHDFCRTDANCPAGKLCGTDNHCHDDLCRTDSDCDAGKRCGTDSKCHDAHDACRADSDCKADERCWDDGKCRKLDNPCVTDADCKDGKHCSSEGKCADGPSCDDQNACTIDRFKDGHCIHSTLAGCTACQTAADCDDKDASTTDVCNAAGICEHRTASTRCTTAADCGTTDACTSAQCAADGSCSLTVDPKCAKPAEICGDCIDNDGNGLTDFEDPACCQQMHLMALTKSRIAYHGQTSALRLRSNLACASSSGINPITQDVVLQVRPATGGDALCARIPAGSFKQRGKSLRFSSRLAGVEGAKGLDGMRITIRRNGSVQLRTRGKRVQMGDMEQGAAQVTLGFAGGASNQCATTVTSFRNVPQQVLVTP